MIDYELLDKQLLPPPVSVTVTENVDLIDAVDEQEEDIFADIEIDQTLEEPEQFEVFVDNVDNVDLGPIDLGDAIFDMFL